MPSTTSRIMKRRSLRPSFLVGLLFFNQSVFGVFAQDGQPELKRQNAARRLLRETSTSWLQEHFPNPEKDPGACGAGGSRHLCDPDEILSASSKQVLDAYLGEPKYIQTSTLCSIGEKSEKVDNDEAKVQFQMGVALVKKVSGTRV